MTALVFLFLAQAQRAFVPALLRPVEEALTAGVHPAVALFALLLLASLAIPLVPVARFVDRTGAVVLAAVAVSLFRLPMTHPSLVARSVGSALALACAGAFLVSAVGHVDRRALGAGAVLGLVADQLLRLAGGGADLSLRPGWLPVQATLSLGLVVAAVLWARMPRPEPGPEELERRGGGLRLRGGIALAALLFLDLTVLGSPFAVARGAATPDAFAAVALAGAAGLGLAASLQSQPLRGRTATLALAAAATMGAVAAYRGGGPLAVGAVSVGHLAGLLLVPRALDPASGRRSGRVVVWVLALLVGLTAAHAVLSRPDLPGPLAALSPLWVLVLAGLLVAGSLALLPRPDRAPPIGGWGLALGVAALVPVLALLSVRGLDRSALGDGPREWRTEWTEGHATASAAAPSAEAFRRPATLHYRTPGIR